MASTNGHNTDSQVTFLEAIKQAMYEEMERDPSVVLIGEDVGVYGGAFKTSEGLLEKFGWSFDINPNYTQMDIIREWVPKISSAVPLILDHCGKPGIRQGALAQFRDDLRDLARYPNMWVKLSDLPPYAGPNWTREQLFPYIAAAIDIFGPERTIYAGDYPILLQSTTLPEWVDVLDEAFAKLGLSEAETRMIYRDNAIRFYRLDLWGCGEQTQKR